VKAQVCTEQRTLAVEALNTGHPNAVRLGSASDGVWSRSHDPPSSLVFSLPFIRNRPQKSALCPSQVRHLHDYLGPHPNAPLVDF
jgi:hypothetical protein